jgi:ribose transport system substrate-binding protein
MNCGTPVCGLLWSLIQGAGKVMGVHLTDYMAGPAVQQTATAFSSMMLTKPSAVIILPTSPLLIEADLLKLKSMKIPVVTSGITWTAAQAKKYHIGAQQSGAAWAVLGGKLLAASTVEMKGTSANAVIQNVPDLEFGNLLTATYISEMKTLCPQCTVSTLSIPIATMGTTDITQEIANLQANPKVNVVASVSSETFFGMPAALSAAGIHVALIGNAPAPLNLKNIVAGTEAGGVGFDLVVSAWTDIDAVARLLDGQAVSHDEVIGLGDQQFLNKKSLLALGPVALKITEAQGWTGYPDFAARFKALWGL